MKPYAPVDTRKRNTLLIIGFLFFIVGIIAFLLDLIGIKIVFLQWMDRLGAAASFGLKIVMLIIGVTLALASRMDLNAKTDEYLEEGRR